MATHLTRIESRDWLNLCNGGLLGYVICLYAGMPGYASLLMGFSLGMGSFALVILVMRLCRLDVLQQRQEERFWRNPVYNGLQILAAIVMVLVLQFQLPPGRHPGLSLLFLTWFTFFLVTNILHAGRNHFRQFGPTSSHLENQQQDR